MEINTFPGVHHPFPQLSAMCSHFFIGEEKAPSCFLEQAETEGHLGVDLGLQSRWVAPLFYDGRRVGFHFPGGGRWRAGLRGAGLPGVQSSGTSKPRAS